jgi:hypothetical protein
MNNYEMIPGILCIAAALCLMVVLMKYAPFYAPSYFFWIGVILLLTGIVSLFKPLAFLFVFNRYIATVVVGCGLLLIVASLFWPVPVFHATDNRKIDTLLPDYSFCEFHKVIVDASPEAVKRVFKTMAVSDVPVIRLLTKIRGIDDKKAVRYAGKTNESPDTFSTPDFNFFIVAPTEMVTVMLLNVSFSGTAPHVNTLEEFRTFRKPGYIKVAVNFRFIDQGNGRTLVTTETRNYATTKEDNYIFARYWRVIYPGSAIIRRLWLDELAKRAKRI